MRRPASVWTWWAGRDVVVHFVYFYAGRPLLTPCVGPPVFAPHMFLGTTIARADCKVPLNTCARCLRRYELRYRSDAQLDQDLPAAALNRPRKDRWTNTAGHAFYPTLNQLPAEAEFDDYVESLCGPLDAAYLGRPRIPPACTSGCCL